MTEIIVIGGGLIGMLTARELAAGGAAVTLVERGEPGREASWAGAGILSPLYPWRYPAAVNALSAWSQARYPALAAELAAETGVDPEWTRSGLVMVDRVVDAAAESWAQGRAAMERVDRTVLADLEPALAAPAEEGLWWPEFAQIRNPRLLAALARSLANKGVMVHGGLSVTGAVREGDRVRGVETDRGPLRADAVVVAAGAWSGGLLARLGGDGGWDIAPVRGQMLLLRAPPGLLRHMILAEGQYLVPRRDGRILVGSTMEYVGFDKSTTAAAYRELHEAALALVPALAECPVERHWAGLRPGSRDGVPSIGGHPRCRGLYVNIGHFRNGVVTGPASARLLADLLLGREPILDPRPYRPRAHAGV